MGANTRHVAVVQHIDARGVNRVCQAVADQNDGMGARQAINRGHDGFLGFDVDVARGLVKDVDRAVAQGRAGQGQALALTARKVLRALGKPRVQTVLLAHKIGKIGQLKGGPQVFVGSVGRRHQEVVPHRACKQMRA